MKNFVVEQEEKSSINSNTVKIIRLTFEIKYLLWGKKYICCIQNTYI